MGPFRLIGNLLSSSSRGPNCLRLLQPHLRFLGQASLRFRKGGQSFRCSYVEPASRSNLLRSQYTANAIQESRIRSATNPRFAALQIVHNDQAAGSYTCRNDQDSASLSTV